MSKVAQISTTSRYRPDTLYTRSKIIAERIAADYAAHHAINVITLRPRGPITEIIAECKAFNGLFTVV